MNFFIKYFFSKGDQVRRKLHFWSHLLKNTLMENFIFLCSGILKLCLENYFFNVLLLKARFGASSFTFVFILSLTELL